MKWQPNLEERKHLELIIIMATDCLLGKGTDTKKTFTQNLELIARLMYVVTPEEGA